MCQTCNGTGHINIDYGWAYGFYPCPDTNCDFDREKAKQELFETMKLKLKELEGIT